MKTKDKTTLNVIFQHKAYFDQRLIEINQELVKTNSTLTDNNNQLKHQIGEKRDVISKLNYKIKDLTIQKYNSEQKILELKKENNDFLEYIKNLENELIEIRKENEKQKEEYERKQREIDATLKKNKQIIKKYENIIKKMKHSNSDNSNMPSSYDILGRTRAKAQANTREKSEKKRGGQTHHPLHKSRLREEAENIIIKRVKKAPQGAVAIKDKKGEIQYYATQEVDLIVKSRIVETRYYIDEKGEELSEQELKTYAINPLTYSGHFKAVTVYLNQKGTIPLQRISEMMEEISQGNVKLQAGTISKWCEECHKKSEKKQTEIIKELLKERVVHVDETGIKVNGKQSWIHTLTNEKGAVFFMSTKRGDKEGGTLQYLNGYEGTIVHDHFVAYQSLTHCKHAECNAHIDRYLKSGIEFDKSSECKEMLELLHEMLNRKKELIENKESKMTAEEIKRYEERYEEVLKRGLEKYKGENPKVKKKYEPEYIKTFRRMIKYKEDHLRFIKDFQVPYTNNAAERQCRVVKTKKNASGQFVSERGAQAYVSILSLLQTAKIKNENALETLESVFH